MTNDVAPWLRDILRCPACGSELDDGASGFELDDGASGSEPDDTERQGQPELVCRNSSCALAYPIRDGIPVLLVDEARPVK